MDMSEVSEATKVEVLKMAVELTQAYVKRGDLMDMRMQEWLGLDEPAGKNLPDIVQALYGHLLGVITR